MTHEHHGLHYFKRLTFALVVSLLLWSAAPVRALLLTQSPLAGMAQDEKDIRAIGTGKQIERELKGGEVHVYSVSLTPGQFLRVVVEQRGIDVVVALIGPDNKKLAEIDSPNGTQGPEPVALVADAAGNYRLEVRSTDKGAAAGRYELRVVDLRDATPHDKGRVVAERLSAEGTVLISQGTVEGRRSAIKKFEEALALWRSAGDQSEQATTLTAIADIYSRSREYSKAIQYSSQALTLVRASGDRKGEALILDTIGAAYLSSNKRPEALEFYNQALTLWRAVGARAEEASTLRAIGGIYFSMNQKPKTLDYLHQVLAVRRALGDGSGEATTLADFGIVYSSMNEYQKALEFFNQALPLQRSLKDRRGEGNTLLQIGGAYVQVSENQKALDHFNQSLLLGRSVGDYYVETMSLIGIAIAYRNVDEYQKALEFYNQSLSVTRVSGDRRLEAMALGNIGVVYADLGEYQKALDYYNQSLPLRREVGDRQGEGTTLNNIGWAYYNLREYQKALDFYNQSLLLNRAAGNRKTEAYALSNIGRIYRDLREYQKALDYFDQSLRLRRAVVDPQGESVSLRNMGGVYTDLGDYQKAQEHLNQALAISRGLKDRDGEGRTLTFLMLDWKARNKPRLAIFFGKQAVNAFQSIRSNIRTLERESQKSFIKSKEDTYRQLADLLISAGRIPEAQQILGLLKEEEYLEFVRRDGTETSSLAGRAALSPEEAALEKRSQEIAEQVVVLGRTRGVLIAKPSRTADEEQQLAKLESDLAMAGQAFQKFLDQLTDELGDTKKAARVDQLRESQALMDDLRELGGGAVALYTIVGEEKYRVILITPDVQKAQEYPIKAADLSRKVAAFRAALQDPKIDPRPLAQDLYRILVAPVAKDLQNARAETLMWSLDGMLRYVPMAALHDGERYMVERYRNVVFTPASTSRLKDLPSAKWRGLGFGVSKAQSGFSALPSVPEELRSIIRDEEASNTGEGVLPGKVMLDEGFTAESMRAALRQRYPLVHIASHFAFQPGNETNSFLLLGDGSRLPLSQIKSTMNLFSGVELLTLSACDTATGGVGADGREVEGFAVLAQRQGAKAVVASLWPVADQSTRLLMEEFYRARDSRQGTPKAEALRRAQLALLSGEEEKSSSRKNKRGISLSVEGSKDQDAGAKPFLKDAKAPYAHPFFWAPFILIGNWR